MRDVAIRAVFTVTRHDGRWAVEHDGEYFGHSADKDVAKATPPSGPARCRTAASRARSGCTANRAITTRRPRPRASDRGPARTHRRMTGN